MRIQFKDFPPGTECTQAFANSGIKHPDFDDSVITDVTEFYRRFAADPDFRVRMLPQTYDVNSPDLVNSLLDADEPVFGEDDLEQLSELKRLNDEKTQEGN